VLKGRHPRIVLNLACLGLLFCAAAGSARAQTAPGGAVPRSGTDPADEPLPIQGEKSSDLVLPEIVITGQARQNLETLTKDEVPNLTSVSLQSTFAEGHRKFESADVVQSSKEPAPVVGGTGCLASTGLAKLFKGNRGRFDVAMHKLRSGKPAEAREALLALLDRAPDPELTGSAHFWLGEIAFGAGELGSAEEQYRIAAESDAHPFQIEALYAVGWIAFQNKQFDAATTAFRGLLKLAPTHDLAPLAQLHVAEASFLQRRYQEALGEFRRILADFPAAGFKDEADYWGAECLYRLGRFEDAAEAYKRYSENFPASRLADDALYGLGYSLLRLSRPDEALEAFQAILLAYPNSSLTASAMSRIGDIYVAQKRFDKAATAYNEVIEKFPQDEGNEYARYRRIFMHHLQGDSRIVLELAEHFLQELPSSSYVPEVLFLAAEAHTALGNLDKAVGFYRQVAQGPKAGLVAAARFRSGLIAFLKGDFTTALSELEALRALPEARSLSDEVLFWRAETLYRLGRYDEALPLYQRVLASPAQHDRFDDALFGLGWIDLRQGHFDQAADSFAKLRSSYPTSPLAGESEFRLGQAQFYGQHYSQAIETIEAFVSSFAASPLVPQALYVLGQCHQRREAFHDAVRRFQELARAYPADPLVPKALYQLGVSQLRLGDFQNAASTFSDLAVSAADPELVRRSLLKGADCLYNLGRYDEAQQQYREIVRRFPDSPEAGDAEYGIGLAYYRTGRFEQFIDEARRFIGQRPGSGAAALVQLLIGEQLYDRHELRRAIDAYEVILKKAPQSDSADDAIFRIGLCYLDLGEPDHAARAMQDLLHNYPKSPLGADALMHLGEIADKAERYHDAAVFYSRVAPEYPTSSLAPESKLREGVALYHSGEVKTAEDKLKSLIDQYVNADVGHRARLELGLIYFEQEHDCGKALDLFEMALRSESLLSAARAQFYVGECLDRTGQKDEAVAAYMKVAYLYPDQGDWSQKAQFRAASVYREKGQSGEALKVLRKLQKENGSEEFKRQVQQEIREIETQRR
jgi:TolA-binding protein